MSFIASFRNDYFQLIIIFDVIITTSARVTVGPGHDIDNTAIKIERPRFQGGRETCVYFWAP